MNIFLTRKNLYLFVLVYAIFAIGYALYIEYYLNFEPCKLCLYQRVPFIFAIFVSFVGYNFEKKRWNIGNTYYNLCIQLYYFWIPLWN